MLKQILMLALLVIAPLSVAKADTPISNMPAGIYELDKGHASLIWKVSHLGLSDYTARFTDFNAEIDLNPTELIASSVSATIDPASVETDYPFVEKKDFDKVLIEDESWFNTGAFPEITFASTEIEVTGENKCLITGDLTMLGVTQPVTLDVTFNKAMLNHPFANKPVLGFSAVGQITRSEWGFDTYVPNIGDDVEIILELEFFKKADDVPTNE